MEKRIQIKMARQALEWSQEDLANESGVGIAAIREFERGNSTPRLDTLDKMVKTLESNNIEFIEGGVRENKAAVTTYKGNDGFNDFRRSVLNEAKTGPIDICVSNVDERQFSQWGSEYVNNNYRKEMAKLDTVSCRILIEEGDQFFVASGFAKYKWVPKNKFGNIPFYIYGDKTAIISFEDNEIYIFVIHHSLITDFYRRQFNADWEQAIDMTKGS